MQLASKHRAFEYLETQGPEDILAFTVSNSELNLFPPDLLTTSQSECNRPCETIFDIILCHPDSELRLAAIGLVAKNPEFEVELSGNLIAIALNDPDSRVRGGALVSISRRWHSPNGQPIVEAAVAHELMERLSSRDPEMAEFATQFWLQRVEHHVQDCESITCAPSLDSPGIADVPREVLDRLGNDPSAAMQYLDSDDPRIQLAALDFLSKTRRIGEAMQKCKELVQASRPVEVRLAALAQLARWYQNTCDQHVSRVIADIVADHASHIYVRDIAYQSLFQINGYPVETWPELRRALNQFSFPEDIDWNLVSRLRERDKSGEQEET